MCDEVLARLARPLRVAGYDALLTEPGAPDGALLALAREEGRVLLTRDRYLAIGTVSASVRVFLIEADAPEEQAAELARTCPVDWLRAPDAVPGRQHPLAVRDRLGDQTSPGVRSRPSRPVSTDVMHTVAGRQTSCFPGASRPEQARRGARTSDENERWLGKSGQGC